MKDTIYRQDAIEVIKGNSFAPGVDYMEINGYGAIEDIRALPSADRSQEWIPCSERLPSEKDYIGDVVIWCTDNSYGRPCVRALNAMCREKRIQIDYTDYDFEKVWKGADNE